LKKAQTSYVLIALSATGYTVATLETYKSSSPGVRFVR